jgi:hypothetical protein
MHCRPRHKFSPTIYRLLPAALGRAPFMGYRSGTNRRCTNRRCTASRILLLNDSHRKQRCSLCSLLGCYLTRQRVRDGTSGGAAAQQVPGVLAFTFRSLPGGRAFGGLPWPPRCHCCSEIEERSWLTLRKAAPRRANDPLMVEGVGRSSLRRSVFGATRTNIEHADLSVLMVH